MTNKEKDELQQQVLKKVKPNQSGRLILAPRSGKTLCMINIIKRDKPKSILWVTPSVILAEQDISKEFIKWKAEVYIKNLTTITWMSLHKIKGYYDLIVLDEYHFSTENNLINLLDNTLKGRIIAMTGTETRHQDKLDLYKKLNLKIIHRLTIEEAVNSNIISDYNINVIEVNLDNRKNIKAGNKKKQFLTSEYLNYQYYSKLIDDYTLQKGIAKKFRILNRMRVIHNSLSKLEAAKYLIKKLKGRKLIFSANINQAEILCKNTFHSKTNDKDLISFQNEEIDTISMVMSGGTGFTYKNIDHLILTQADSNKNGRTVQRILRSFLKQDNYKALIWIIMLKGTQDETWVNLTLENFNKNKIKYYKNLKI